MLTLSDIQDDLGIQRTMVYCPTSPEAIDLINMALRMLMRRGDWNNTVVPIYVCVYNGCVVWPRYVRNVRKIQTCNVNMQVENMWYRFMDGVNGCDGWANGWNNWAAATPYGQWHLPVGFLQQQGKSSVFQDIQGDGRLVRAYARCPQDLGLTVTIYGTDNNGQPLQQRDVNKNIIMGNTLILQKPFASTSTYVRHIDYVLKDKTQCPINLYAYNASADVLEDLAQYDPSETRPSYDRTRINIQSPYGCPSSYKRGVLALVKIRHIEVQDPTDLVFIDNIDAIHSMIQSLKKSEAGDLVSSKILQNEAIEEMNRDLEDQSPDQQFAAIDNTFGGTTFSNHLF